jgi:two-component system sensor histidine kinase RpfC
VRPESPDAEGVFRLANRYRQRADRPTPLHVLVAEDNPTNQKVIVKILERAGHTTHLVENGEQALDALEKGGFDLALLDLHMPVMGGLDVARSYRFLRTERARIPIAALTADATPEAKRACEEAGFQAFLTKPIEARKLLDVISTLSPSAAGNGERVANLRVLAPNGPKPVPPEDAPVLDPDTLQELMSLGGRSDFVEKLIHVFFASAEQSLQDMEAALSSRDGELFRDRAHALKGNAGQLGAVALMERCSRLSRMGQAELLERGAEHLAAVREEYSRASSELRRYLKKTGTDSLG